MRPRQRVKHREHRSCPDARAQQDNGPVPGPQNESSARSGDFKHATDSDIIAKIASGCPVRFDLQCEAVLLSRRGTGQRVAAKEWIAGSARLKPNDNVLSW